MFLPSSDWSCITTGVTLGGQASSELARDWTVRFCIQPPCLHPSSSSHTLTAITTRPLPAQSTEPRHWLHCHNVTFPHLAITHYTLPWRIMAKSIPHLKASCLISHRHRWSDTPHHIIRALCHWLVCIQKSRWTTYEYPDNKEQPFTWWCKCNAQHESLLGEGTHEQSLNWIFSKFKSFFWLNDGSVGTTIG